MCVCLHFGFLAGNPILPGSTLDVFPLMRGRKSKKGACPCRSSKHIGTEFLVLTKGEHMHNTEYEKYPTSGEENVEVDVHWPIQDA